MAPIPRRRFMQQSALAVLGSNVLLKSTYAADGFVTANTRFGKVRGIETGGIKAFKGIAYGADTSGPNRFMPPLNPQPWSGVRDALEYGHSAPQNTRTAPPLALASRNLPVQGEDCLVLNLWTPALNDGRKRPVMFWCHGGGFTVGSGSSPDFDGSNLCRRGDVVVVAIHHRLNALGFSFLAELGGSDFAASGNVGMLDIIHALRWVRDNIGEFGGDPNNVTVFGQSGGGAKAGVLLGMPAARGLFHRAIMQSGARSLRIVDRAQAHRNADLLLKKLALGKSDVRKAQELPFSSIVSAYLSVMADNPPTVETSEGFAPVVDGTNVPQHPFDPVASPLMPDVPLIVGSNRTETTVFSMGDPASFSLDEAGLSSRIVALLGQQAEAVLQTYRRVNPKATPSDLFFLIGSDHRYTGPAMKTAERRAALGKAPVYSYFFTWETPIENGKLKSPHSLDVPFVFDNVRISSHMTGGGADAIALADRVSSAWIAFARTGDPNTTKLPKWPPYDAQHRSTMVLNDASRVEKDPIREQRIAIQQVLGFA